MLCALLLSRAVAPQVDEGGRVPLLARHRLALDYDAAAREELKVTVLTLPTYGCIENTKTGKHPPVPFTVCRSSPHPAAFIFSFSVYCTLFHWCHSALQVRDLARRAL